MTLAFDATTAALSFSANANWNHVPVGAPRAVVAMIVQNVEALDEIAGVTYGGVPMTEVPLSPFLHALGSEDGTLYAYFLGSGIPVGTQVVAVTVSGSTRTKRGISVSLTGAGDTEIVDTSTFESASTVAPAATVDTPAGLETFIIGLLHSGALTSGILPGTDYTELDMVSFGSASAAWIRRTINGSGGSYSVDWSHPSLDEDGILALAIREISGQNARLAMVL